MSGFGVASDARRAPPPLHPPEHHAPPSDADARAAPGEEGSRAVLLSVSGLAGAICQKSVCRDSSVRSVRELLAHHLVADCRELKLFLGGASRADGTARAIALAQSELSNDELLSQHLENDETSVAITLVRESCRAVEVERQALAILALGGMDVLQVDSTARRLSEMELADSDDARYMVTALLEEALHVGATQDAYVALLVALQRHFVRTVPDTQGGTQRSFRNVLLNVCQSLWEAHDFASLEPSEVARFEQRRARFVSLFGAMFLEKLFSVKVLANIVGDLIGVPGTERATVPAPRDMESTALLLAQVGPDLEQRPVGKQLLGQFLQRLAALAAQKQEGAQGSLVYGARIRFLVQDLLDLRSRRWIKTGRLSVLERCR